MEKKTEEKEMTIEQAFARLEEITAKMEDTETSLEESFALYKEGSELLNRAGAKIDLVEKQLQVLQAGSLPKDPEEDKE